MAIVTLSTDIGQQDYIVGAFKGQLLTANKALNIIDISHYLSLSNFPEAAYICGNAFINFPEKTIHIIILNFFEEKSHNILLAEYNNQYIICADNGILTMIADDNPIKVYAIPYNSSATFLTTTEQIANIVSELANGILPSEIANQTINYFIKLSLKPTVSEDWIRGHIIFIDNFENVVVNITKSVFKQYRRGRKFSIVFKRNEKIIEFSSNYLSVADGEKLAWFNSAGYLELAINKGNMAGLFGLEGFNDTNSKEGKALQNKFFYTHATIFFE